MSGEEEPLVCSPFAEPSDGLEPSTPSLPWNAACNRSQRTATVLAYFCGSCGRGLAADCHRLQPRGSIKAPSPVVRAGYVARMSGLDLR
jgi:hypothetical protein